MSEVFIKVFGQVQGVGFRYHSRQKARELSLVGWVCNASDGTVEILAQGEKADLEKFVEWVKAGPGLSAKVERVEISFQPIRGGIYADFAIRN